MQKNFLSETTRPRVFIFGVKHHLVNLYQVCSNYIHWAKNGLPRAYAYAYIGKNMKTSCLKPYDLEP